MKERIPNALTVLRIVLAAAFPFAPVTLRPVLVLAALATEYLDGALSRRLHAETLTGQLLDPIADKLFFAAVSLTFLLEGRLAAWELLCLAIRDLAVAFWALRLALGRRWGSFAGMKPGLSGKVTTTLQYACLLDLLFQPRLNRLLLAVTAFTSALAALRYYGQATRNR